MAATGLAGGPISVPVCTIATTCIEFLSDPAPENTDAGFTANTAWDNGPSVTTPQGTRNLRVGDVLNFNPSFINEGTDGTVAGMNFTVYTATNGNFSNTFQVVSDAPEQVVMNPPGDGGFGDPVPIPEPFSGGLIGVGLVGFTLWRVGYKR